MSDTAPDLTRLSAMLCFDVYATNLAFGRVYKPHLDPLGLTYPQYLVMMVLSQGQGHSVGDIGVALGLESSTLTPMIKRMEQAGLLQRRRDMQDERRVRVTLTDQGRALWQKARQVPACVAQATGMDMSRIDALQQELRQLRLALESQPLA